MTGNDQHTIRVALTVKASGGRQEAERFITARLNDWLLDLAHAPPCPDGALLHWTIQRPAGMRWPEGPGERHAHGDPLLGC